MALFVLSYARNDGEALVRKFFDRLCGDLAVMYPQEREIGFMDTEGIATGATWQETLGGKLQVTPVLVPVFSPSFFASPNCGQEVQAFLERMQLYANANPPPIVTPLCILPVIWVWENLTIHPIVRNIHYDNVNYPQNYRSKKTGLRMLADITWKRNQFKILTNHLAIAINNALQTAQAGAGLPPGRTDYRQLPNAFATVNASPIVSGPKSVQFAYIAPSQAELGAVRTNVTTYGAEGRDWRAFDPACPNGIGHLSESVAANLRMAYDVLPLDAQFTSRIDGMQDAKGQVVFIVDTWAAQVSMYNNFFAEVDKEKYRDCPVLVPINDRDEENRTKRSLLLEALRRRLPNRAARGGLVTGFADEFDYQAQLGRTLVARQSELVRTASSTSPVSLGTLPMI